MTGVEDMVVAELRSQKIKLWEVPYVNDDQTSPNRASLGTLADQLLTKLPSSLSKNDIVTALLSLQEHALNKKRAKQAAAASSTVVCNLEVKVVGLRHDIPNEPTQATWANRVEIKPKALVFHGLSPKLTIGTFTDELQALLQVASSRLRLVHRGKSISDDERLPLVQVLSQHCKSHKTTLLCIVSPTVDTTAETPQQDSSQSQPSPTHSLIRSIRDAATKLASNTFEVTDQHGNHVSMLPQERLAFLTALGLHAIGKQRLSTSNWSDALVFLLEADHEWNGVAQQWRDRVDNYGLLQLDICWLYLKLESLESLEDVVKRLDLAERVLRKQVHTNFVTLALVQADMGNPVPPLSAVFCRLFLLQGIAYHCCKAPSNKSKERLEWAYALCSSLRSVSTKESVTSLQGVMPNLTQEQAISALRRTNGNPNQAAQLIETDKTNAIQHESKRRTQRKLGLCENTKDYVNLDLLEQLQSVLGLPSATTDAATFSLEHVNTQAAGGLLRLTNNDMERAIDLYQEVGRNPNAVLQRLDALDDSLRKRGIESPRRKRSREHEVDQVALATLVSMGVQEPTAKQALEKSQNNVEMALLWLSEGADTASNGSYQDDMLEEAVDAADGTDGSNQDDMSGEANVDDDDESSDDSSGSSHNDSKSSSSHNDARTLQERERDQALELLQQELGQALQEKDLESEYLGSTLDEEWDFLAKFRSN